MGNARRKLANLSTREKIIAAAVVLFFILIIWQIMGLFGGEETAPPPAKPTTTAATGQPQGPPPPPKPTALPPKPPLSQREIELIKLQQDTQAKYLAAANELQILRIERDIAQTNQAIAAAKLATVTAQKNVIDLLTPPTPPPVPTSAYAANLANPPAGQTIAAEEEQKEVTYVVLSVSYTLHKWNALVGFQGKIYTVSVGDILPPDGSTVVAIDSSGITIKKDSMRRKITVISVI